MLTPMIPEGARLLFFKAQRPGDDRTRDLFSDLIDKEVQHKGYTDKEGHYHAPYQQRHKVRMDAAPQQPQAKAPEKPQARTPAVGEAKQAAPSGLRYDPSVNRYNGQPLTRGDVLVDAKGQRYTLDRANGFMLTLDRQSDGVRIDASVDPFDKTRFVELKHTGKNQFDVPPAKADDAGVARIVLDDWAERQQANWLNDGMSTYGLNKELSDRWNALTTEQQDRIRARAEAQKRDTDDLVKRSADAEQRRQAAIQAIREGAPPTTEHLAAIGSKRISTDRYASALFQAIAGGTVADAERSVNRRSLFEGLTRDGYNLRDMLGVAKLAQDQVKQHGVLGERKRLATVKLPEKPQAKPVAADAAKHAVPKAPRGLAVEPNLPAMAKLFDSLRTQALKQRYWRDLDDAAVALSQAVPRGTLDAGRTSLLIELEHGGKISNGAMTRVMAGPGRDIMDLVARLDAAQDQTQLTARETINAWGREGHAATAPQEGSTKTENGVTYVLRDGRWHRQSPEKPQAATPPAKATVESRLTYPRDGDHPWDKMSELDRRQLFRSRLNPRLALAHKVITASDQLSAHGKRLAAVSWGDLPESVRKDLEDLPDIKRQLRAAADKASRKPVPRPDESPREDPAKLSYDPNALVNTFAGVTLELVRHITWTTDRGYKYKAWYLRNKDTGYYVEKPGDHRPYDGDTKAKKWASVAAHLREAGAEQFVLDMDVRLHEHALEAAMAHAAAHQGRPAKEGDTSTVNGVTYVYRKFHKWQWYRQDLLAKYTGGRSLGAAGEELSTKALGGSNPVWLFLKSRPKRRKRKVCMDADEFQREHERLVEVLRSPGHADDLREARKQALEVAHGH